MHGYEDLTLGHVSARGADGRTIYIKRKGVALGEVTPADVVAVDLDADHDRVPRRDAPRDRPAHRGLQAPPGCAQRRPRPPAVRDRVRRDRRRVRLPDARQRAVRRRDLDLRRRARPDRQRAPGGARSPRRSATAPALLLRNHGVLVAERDVRWAVLASVLLERAVRLQMIAGSLGAAAPDPRRSCCAGIHAVKYQADFPASTGTPGCASCAAAAARSTCRGALMAAERRRDRDRADRQRRPGRATVAPSGAAARLPARAPRPDRRQALLRRRRSAAPARCSSTAARSAPAPTSPSRRTDARC